MALLFAQMAVAAYACPVAMGPGDMLRAAWTAQTSMAMMPDCDSHSSGNPNLCVQHCQSGNQTVQTAPHIPVPPLAVTHVIEIETILADASHGVASLPLYLERETSPPPLLRFGFLRI